MNIGDKVIAVAVRWPEFGLDGVPSLKTVLGTVLAHDDTSVAVKHGKWPFTRITTFPRRLVFGSRGGLYDWLAR